MLQSINFHTNRLITRLLCVCSEFGFNLPSWTKQQERLQSCMLHPSPGAARNNQTSEPSPTVPARHSLAAQVRDHGSSVYDVDLSGSGIRPIWGPHDPAKWACGPAMLECQPGVPVRQLARRPSLT